MMVSMTSTVDWQAVLLDLLNTTPVIDGQTVDQLADAAAARTWLRVHGAARGEDVDGVRTVRDDLQRVVRMEADPSVLRRYLTGVRQVPDVGDDGIEWELERGVDRAGRAGLGRAANRHAGSVAALCQRRVQAVPDRPLTRRHGAVVLDERVRQPDEGAPSLPAGRAETETAAAPVFGSVLPDWLEALGRHRPGESTVDAFLGYASRMCGTKR